MCAGVCALGGGRGGGGWQQTILPTTLTFVTFYLRMPCVEQVKEEGQEKAAHHGPQDLPPPLADHHLVQHGRKSAQVIVTPCLEK